MATYYVRKSGNDANSGLSPSLAKLTYTAAYNAASSGDTIYIGAGVYREAQLTTSKQISFIGDYLGTYTGDAGLVMFRGSAADVTATTGTCLQLNSSGASGTIIRWIAFSGWSSHQILLNVGAINVTITDCAFHSSGGTGGSIHHAFSSTLSTALTVERCLFVGTANGIWYSQGDNVDRTINWTVRNCVFMLWTQGAYGVNCAHGGGLLVENCTFLGTAGAVIVGGSGTMTTPGIMRYCLVESAGWWVAANTLGFLVEDYNVFSLGGYGGRTNVAAGANSVTRVALLEMRVWFEALRGRISTMWDVGADWQVINNAIGAGGYATDARGATVLGANREVGALEYNSALGVAGSTPSSPSVMRSPAIRGER